MSIDTSPLTQNPFTVITFMAAPAILTNAASIVSLSTSTRLMRCLDRINQLTERLNRGELSQSLKELHIKQVELSHLQSRLFLGAMRATYMSLACFATASFSALIGALAAAVVTREVTEWIGGIGLLIGAIGVSGFIIASVHLIRASQITVQIMATDVEQLKSHHELLP